MSILKYKTETIIHQKVSCDGCDQYPLIGDRWKCSSCKDYDLCSDCLASNKHSAFPTHAFEKNTTKQKIKKDTVIVPLTSSRLIGKVSKSLASLCLIQSFINTSDKNFEVLYSFPMDPKISFVSCCIRIGDRTIEANIEEKEKAKNKYDDAIASGNNAYLIEASSSDSYNLSLGKLDAGESCTVELFYVCNLQINTTLMQASELKNINYTLTIPTLVSPKYGEIVSGSGISASEIKVDITGTTGSEIINNVSCTEGDLACAFEKHIWTLQGTVKKSGDIVTMINVTETEKVSVICERTKILKTGDSMDTDLYNYSCAIYASPSSKVVLQSEYIFVIDCSGSMDSTMKGRSSKTKIDGAKAAVLLFLKALPNGSMFNIFRFGDNFLPMFDSSRVYSEETLAIAENFVKGTNADMGGTELLKMMQHLLNRSSENTNIILLTDGDVSNTEQVIKTAQAGKATVFSIGEKTLDTLELMHFCEQRNFSDHDYGMEKCMLVDDTFEDDEDGDSDSGENILECAPIRKVVKECAFKEIAKSFPGGGKLQSKSLLRPTYEDIIALQSWNGSWSYSSVELVQTLGNHYSQFEKFAKEMTSLVDPDVQITAFVIVVLHNIYASDLIVWTLMCDKAIQFLAQKGVEKNDIERITTFKL